MEINRKSNEFPEEIIQHIQSYMRGRDAARTTLLNKSWHRAWLTRPSLNFNRHEFRRGMVEFEEFTKKTIQRYEDLKLKIHNFKLRRQIQRDMEHSLAAELILKAIELGATHLNLYIPTIVAMRFVLPDELLQSKTLARLSLYGCTLDLERIITKRDAIITFPNLKSVNISSVVVKGDFFGYLISRFPSIEELTLDNPINSSKSPLPLDLNTLIKLQKLKYLKLDYLDMRDCLFCGSDLWSKFSCLKELVIFDFFSEFEHHEDLRICSTSLERITIRSYKYKNMNAQFDVPNVRMFRLTCTDLLRVDLKPSTREWEADVHITCKVSSNPRASWFSALNRLVKMLGRSRVSLHISLCCRPGDGDGYVGDGLDIPALENLTITGTDTISPGFLEALFSSCRPNFLEIARHFVNDIKKVNVEGFPKLQSLPWKTLLDASRGLGHETILIKTRIVKIRT